MRKYQSFSQVFIIGFLLIITAKGLFAQELFERPMNRPVKYLKPTIKTQSNTGIAHDMTPQSWHVWIDREGVVTSNGKSTLFLEQFFVVEESEEHVHIVKDNGSFDFLAGRFNKLQQPIDYGWIPKDRLILWSSALYSDETTFRIKVLNITDNAMNGQSVERIMRGEKLIEYFNSPSTSQPNKSRAKLDDIYYIYKKLDNRSLVGIKESLLKNNQHSIVGWVDNSMIHFWEHRVAMVLYFDSDELNDLIVTLGKLTNPMIDASGRREGLYNAFMQTLVVNFGVNIDDVRHLPISKIMELITGIESTSELLKRYTLDDIQDPITMDDGEIDGVIEYIKTKRDLLQRIIPDNRYYFISNMRPYYWLPQDVLP